MTKGIPERNDMNALIIYDSKFGNTEKIAQTIGSSVPKKCTFKVKHIDQVVQSDLLQSEIIFIGSPTQGGRATEAMNIFLDTIPESIYSSKVFAVFDTRLREERLSLALKLLIRVIGYAAPKIAQAIKNRNGSLIGAGEGFYVTGKEGPLEGKEIDRAKKWTREVFLQFSLVKK